jgi:NAD+ dependent glucose-6-phosphate dehydrogenase
VSQPRRTVVVITGATGNIGRKLWRHLEAQGGYELRLLCLNPENDPAVVTADLSRVDPVWTDQFSGADAVLHLAGNPANQAGWDALIAPNIDAVLNVYIAAAQHGVKRVVAASSVWSLYGYRFADMPLIPSLPQLPTNPYGTTKVLGERVGEAFFANYGITGVAFRIGACRRGQNSADHDMTRGDWEQSCWVSDRDVCQGLEKAVTAAYDRFAVLNLTSANAPSRWGLEATRALIGYVPQDGFHVRIKPLNRVKSVVARLIGTALPAALRRAVSPRW